MSRLLNFFSQKVSSRTGGIVNAAAYGSQFLVTLLLTPLVISFVGKDGFGLWVLVSSLSGYYGLVNLGLSSALVRHVALYSAREDTVALDQVCATALAFLTITGTCVFLASSFFAPALVRALGVAPGHSAEFVAVIRLAGFATALDFPGVVFTSILNARERFFATGVMNIARNLLRAACTVIFLMLGFGIVGLGYTAAAMSLVLLGTNAVLAVHVYGAKAFAFRGANWSTLLMLIRFGASSLLLNVVDIVRVRLGPMMLANSGGVGAIATFGLASSLVIQFNGMVGTVVGVLGARFARLDAKADKAEIRVLFRKSLFLCGTISFGFVLAVFLSAGRFIELWVGKGFLPAVPVLYILASAYGLAAAQSSGWSLMFGLGKHHFMAVVSVAEIAIIVGLSAVLVPRYGATGMAAAVAIGMFLTKAFVQPLYLSRTLSMSIRSYLAPFSGPALAALAVWILFRAPQLSVYAARGSIGMFVVLCAVICLIYAGFVVALCGRKSYFVNPIPDRRSREISHVSLGARKA